MRTIIAIYDYYKRKRENTKFVQINQCAGLLTGWNVGSSFIWLLDYFVDIVTRVYVFI